MVLRTLVFTFREPYILNPDISHSLGTNLFSLPLNAINQVLGTSRYNVIDCLQDYKPRVSQISTPA